MADTVTEHYNITGINPGEENPPVRQEFSVWANDPQSIQVSLMIRALQLFYDIPYTEKLSYFQIGGIHGYPKQPWDGSPEPAEQLDQSGNRVDWVYCPHGTIRFPTWHRPYMLLFEQRLHELMLDAIEKLIFHNGEKKQWTDEAHLWRLPYWDWASTGDTRFIPELFKPETISIRVPKGSDGSQPAPQPVPNPLYRYECIVDGKPKAMGDLLYGFKIDDNRFDKGPLDVYPWSECSGTSRWGIEQILATKAGKDWKTGYNNWEGTNRALQNHAWYPEDDPRKPPTTSNVPQSEQISDAVYRMMTDKYIKSWHEFSTTKYAPGVANDWTDYLSIEYIHNNLHNFIGGGGTGTGFGHMEDVPVAAFDPIFYFHHCNIDRQLAIWQTLHPKNWFDGSLFGSKDPKPDDPLYPFWRFDTTSKTWRAYTSNDIREWTKLGYQYDVLAPQQGEVVGDAKYIERIKKYVDTYKNTGQGFEDVKKSVLKHLDGKLVDHNIYPDYLIDVIYDRHGYNGYPYNINFYLGGTQVGTVYTFSSAWGEDGGCANCEKQKADGDLSTAQIAITSTLLQQAADDGIPDINTIDVAAVSDYLAKKLTWKAVSMGGNEIPAEALPKTKVIVVHGKGQHFPEPEKLSKYSDYKPLPPATDGKDWGYTAQGQVEL